jgi:hypothetical protein
MKPQPAPKAGRPARRVVATLATASALSTLGLLLASCGSSSGDSKTVTVQGDIAIAYTKRDVKLGLNPTNGAPSLPGGDLMIREKASPSAPEHNITTQFTQDKGDVSDPSVSYDGKKIVFAMRCPTSNAATTSDGAPACTGHWNIWEYDMTTGGMTNGTFRRITSSAADDDVDPVYLPGSQGFVFSSNRQTQSKANQALGHSYYALDEYERERVFNLHTMAPDGTKITQISFNQSHDRSPQIRPDGTIMFSRWDHVGGRNHFKVFTVKPDGTDMFVLYGAHSEGNSFLHPHDMDPAGKYKGWLVSDVMPLQRTNEGGALMLINAKDYSEQNTPINPSVPASGGQLQATQNLLNLDRGLSRYGRVTTPYPMWDGTDRVLVGYVPCEVTKDNQVVSCATLTDAEIQRVSDMNRSTADVAADTIQNNVPPAYAIYMFDATTQSWLNVATPPRGFMYKNPVSLTPRPEPATSTPTSIDTGLAAQNLGTLDVRSVYDTDGLGRMGTPVLGTADLRPGCLGAIAQTKPSDPDDTRPTVADIVRIKNPADPAYWCSPARFIRAVRAVAPPSSTMGLRSAIGETDFEPTQILGYAPIDPDGSFKLNVPADTPIALSVIDANGRAFQTHTNWIQVRPGERRTCDGCHSPRRGGAINSGAVVNSVPTAWVASMQSAHQSGETMADTRTRLDPTQLALQPDMVYTDVWADTTQQGVRKIASISIKYKGNDLPADDLATAVPTNGVINYPDHIAPLWARDRGTNTCTACHNNSDKLLDLTATTGGSGRLASYDSLLIGAPELDANGKPVIFFEDGEPMLERLPAMVATDASEDDVTGLSRKSRLFEILAGGVIMSDATSQSTYPAPPASAPDHSKMLNKAEMRLLAEWIDTGGKYYNDPFAPGSGVRTLATLNQDTFVSTIYPILTNTCAGCHQALGSDDKPVGSTSFHDNRFVLTGSPDGDFNVTMTMISDTCHPPLDYLLARPSTIPHPPGITGQTTAILPAASADYKTVSDWILTGCPTP